MTPTTPTAPSPRAMRRVTIAELLAYHPHLRDQVARAITATESPDVQDQLLALLETDHQLATAARMLDCGSELERVEHQLKLHDLREQQLPVAKIFELEARRSELRRISKLRSCIESELTANRRRLQRFGMNTNDERKEA